MSELQHKLLADYADVIMGQSPESNLCNTEGKGLPFLQGSAEFGRQHPRSAIFCHPSLRTAKLGAVLISVRAPVGSMNYADQNYCIGRGLGAFKAKPGISDTVFLRHAVEHHSNFLQRRSQGSTFAAVSTSDFRSVPIPAFDFPTQGKIAAILSTIDTAIEQTEVLIEKYQHIKAGLMHDLFTRGVLLNGQLRPPREQSPELYQETAIGWIPREWRLKRCIDLCSRICVGIVIQPTQHYVEAGVPALRSANVRADGIDPSNFVYITEKSNQILGKSQLRTGDIVSVRTGYPGTSAVVPLEFNGANCIDILISTPTAEVCSDYLCFWINSSFGKEQVLRQQGGMAQQHFNVGEMRELLVAVPKLEEQEAICGKLKATSQQLAIERARREKMQLQKLGLMQDLLTGKVAVTVDVPAIEVTT